MKTSELTSKDLDYWVAKSQGWELAPHQFLLEQVWKGKYGTMETEKNYYPSVNGGQCFELMKLDSFRWVHSTKEGAVAMFNQLDKLLVSTKGETLNIAICRAFVASVYGEEVSDE